LPESCGKDKERAYIFRSFALREANLRIPDWTTWWARWGHKKDDGNERWPILDNRQALRLPLSAQVLIYGRLGNKPFSENTETIDVCALGGLVRISAHVRRAQRLVLTNLHTEEDLVCRVVRLVKTEDGKRLVGLAFLQPGPRFWRSGPATDSSPTR
jgi:hypothetical protein